MAPTIICQEDTDGDNIFYLCNPELGSDGLPLGIPVTPVDYYDNCDNSPSLSYKDSAVTKDGCINSVTRTFTVTDACGNKNSCDIIYEWEFDQFENCETAFGVFTTGGDNPNVEEADSRCFSNDGFKRWGWTNQITVEGSYELDLYAGAAQCNIAKGAYVGKVTVNYLGTTATVTYMIEEGYAMSEAHIYVGCEMYPTKNGTNTVAPGQYTYNAGSLDHVYQYSVEFTDIDEEGFYIIAHAVVCEEICRCSPVDNSGSASGISAEECNASKVAVTKSVDFTAYPVPFESEVNLKYSFDYDTDINIEVFDMKGALVRKAENRSYIKGTTETTKIDLSRTDNQMFFVRLTTKQGTIIKKIVSSTPQ